MLTQTVPLEHGHAEKLTCWQRVRTWAGSDALTGYAFVLPAFAWIAFLVAMPFCIALAYSVSNAWIDTEWSWAEFFRLRDGELEFVGLKNFIALFYDRIFLQTLQNSVVFSVLSVALKAVFGLTLALLLNRTLRFNKLIRGILLLPFVVPTALSTLAWWWMFDSLYSVVNWTMVHLGLIRKGWPWLSDPYLAMLPKEGGFGHPRGWPYRPTPEVARIEELYLLPDMVARALREKNTKAAIQWTEDEIAKIMKEARERPG